MEQELDELLSELQALPTVPGSEELQQQKQENKRMKSLLVTMKDSTKEMLELYKSERRITINLQEKLDNLNKEHIDLQRKFDDLDRNNVNNTLSYNQEMNELKRLQAIERDNYIELSRDYFETLSDTTCLFNYEIKKPQNKIISKTEKFLRDCLGDNFKKPKIIQSKRMQNDDNDSIVSRTSSRATKRSSKDKGGKLAKRMKTDIWDMKSISQASSPAAVTYDEETLDVNSADSNYSSNFSIGNETTFTSLQNTQAPSSIRSRCNCLFNPETLRELVSVGVNTDAPVETPPNLPLLSYDCDSTLEFEPTVIATGTDSSTECPDQDKSDDHLQIEYESKYTTSSTNTEEDLPNLKEMVDHSTSPEPVETCNKSTTTVRSTTTRGTYTTSPEKRSFGVQYPEINIEKIFKETIFDLPDCIEQIEELEVPMKETASIGTITELCNVNREIDYVCKLKTETLSFEEFLISRNEEEKSFVVLGQTLFHMFLNRIRKSKEFSDEDEITRRKIWKHVKRQLVDRFSELSFNETFNASSCDFETQENMMPQESEDQIASKFKEGKEEFAVPPLDEFNPTNTEDNTQQTEDGTQQTEDGTQQTEDGTQQTEEIDKSMDSLSSDCEANNSMPCEMVASTPTEDLSIQNEDEVNTTEFEEVFKNMNQFCDSLPSEIPPISDLTKVMWDFMFPNESDEDDSPEEISMSADVIEGYDIEHEPIEIPTETDMEVTEILKKDTSETTFSEFDSPKSPVQFITTVEDPPIPKDIPLEKATKLRNNFDCVLAFNQVTKVKMSNWQRSHQIHLKAAEKQLRKIRKAIQSYLDADWTDESVDRCFCYIKDREKKILIEAIYETVEDNRHQTTVCSELSPPAPPLPNYQQKLILLIKKVSEEHPDLPHLLLEDFEEKLLRLDSFKKEIEDLRNFAYYYSALVDLFFDGDTTMIFYFIVKCIYFLGHKSIPMIFVLIKAFPRALPKKSLLLKKYSTSIDWENMTGLELSKVHFDTNCMDSLDLTVMFYLTSNSLFRKGHESEQIKEHELFNYLPKFYGFNLNFMPAVKLLDILMKRLESGLLENLSLSFILLARRASTDFSVNTIVENNLLTALKKFLSNLKKGNEIEPLVSQVCLVIEATSSIAKTYTTEKTKKFKQLFSIYVSVLSSVNNNQIKECCIKAILRIQRFIENQKEIVSIIKHYQDNSEDSISDGLRYAIKTFVHRKDEKFLKT